MPCPLDTRLRGYDVGCAGVMVWSPEFCWANLLPPPPRAYPALLSVILGFACSRPFRSERGVGSSP